MIDRGGKRDTICGISRKRIADIYIYIYKKKTFVRFEPKHSTYPGYPNTIHFKTLIKLSCQINHHMK